MLAAVAPAAESTYPKDCRLSTVGNLLLTSYRWVDEDWVGDGACRPQRRPAMNEGS
jgi:hypothetical protein